MQPSTFNSSLHIRTANAADTPAIIELLRSSLGDSTIPKSEQLWSWKHIHNPFGNSYVLVAEENGKLIGVRAFMQWQFTRRNKVFRALRAVDTATHPDHQGKGIFKKLTLHLVEICKSEGIHFIFNTPNEQSKPGYLKMGWFEQGKLKMKFRFVHPFSVATNILLKRNVDRSQEAQPFQKWTTEVYDLLDYHLIDQDRMSTVLSSQYISWRYGNNPLFRYYYLTDFNTYLLIYRLKDHSFGREMRITEFLQLYGDADQKQVKKSINKSLSNAMKEHKVDFISMSASQQQFNQQLIGSMSLIPSMAVGPIITLRDLNMKSDFVRLSNLRYWNYSTGDLELF